MKKILLSLLIALMVCAITHNVLSQTLPCGFSVSQETIDHINSYKNDINTYVQNFRQTKASRLAAFDIPIKIHIVRMNNGQGGISPNQIADAIELMNEHYSYSNYNFIVCENVNFINNTQYYDFIADDDEDLINDHYSQDKVNIYFFNSIESNGSSLCGYTYFPWDNLYDVIFMKNECATNKSTLSHEMGHYLGL